VLLSIENVEVFVFRTTDSPKSFTIHFMARGWESKSVEEQQAESASGRKPAGPVPTAEQSALDKRAKDLQLSKAHVVEQLRRATNHRHRKLLEDAMAHLETELAALG
jgi:hypothetical protein